MYSILLFFGYFFCYNRKIDFRSNPLEYSYVKIWLGLLVLGVIFVSFGYQVYFVKAGSELFIDKMVFLCLSSLVLSRSVLTTTGVPRGSIQEKNTTDLYLMIALFICLISVVYVVYSSKRLPILELFSNKESLMTARFQSKFNYTGNIYVKNILFGKLIKFFALVAYSRSFVHGSSIGKPLLYIYIMLALFVELFDGEKAPLIIFLTSLLIVRMMHVNINSRVLLLYGVFSFFLVLALYAIIETGDVLFLLQSMMNRIFIVPVAGLLLTLKYIPAKLDFMWGASFPGWLIGPLGIEHKRSARAIMEVFNPSGVQNGTAGVMNSWFQAEAYANFGFLFALVAPLVVTFLLLFLRKFLALLTPSVRIAVVAFLFFEIPYFGGFVDLVWNVKIFAVLFVARLISLNIK